MTDLKRTQGEIYARIRHHQAEDEALYGRTAASHLTLLLPRELGVTAGTLRPLQGGEVEAFEVEWEEKYRIHDDEALLDVLREKLKTAWIAANKCRGDIARDVLASIRAFVWASGPEHGELVEKLDALQSEFAYYGKQGLVAASEAFDVDWRGLDNDEWRIATKAVLTDDEEKPRTADQVLQLQ